MRWVQAPAEPSEGNKRPYRSPLRAGQGRVTQQQIRRVAERLFLQRGYAKVSMTDIAEAAGVARQTVFSTFGSKSGLIRDLIDVRIAGKDTPVSVARRGAIERMREEPDPRQLLRVNARLIAEISERTAALYEVLAEAAGTDTEAEALQRRIDRQWLEGMGYVVDLVAELGALPSGADRDRARESLWLLSAAHTYLMARAQGWSLDAYTKWLGDCSISVVLDGHDKP